MRWQSLPAEMKLSVVDYLGTEELKSFSHVNQGTRLLVVPSLFRHVKLDGHNNVTAFLIHVPARYCAHVRHLEASFRPNQIAQMCQSTQTDLMISLLNRCTLIRQLVLYVFGSPGTHVISCFTRLKNLMSLHIGNSAPESLMPLSERSVVSIAASVPFLRELTLDGVTRSLIHAPELLAIYPYIPLVTGDEDIDNHPVLGSSLCLPSLLRIPTLRKLRLLDTHLGDQLWASTYPLCSLEILDLGSCGYETPEFNRTCTERIVYNVANHCPIKSLHVNTSIEGDVFRHPSTTPLQLLQHIHLMPLLPANQVVQTLLNLSGSPVEIISIECYEEDAVGMCHSLEEFLNLRTKGHSIYGHLKEIYLHFVVLDPSVPMTEHRESLGRVKGLCTQLNLKSDMPAGGGAGDHGRTGTRPEIPSFL